MAPYTLWVSPNVEGADYIISYEVSNTAYINSGYFLFSEVFPGRCFAVRKLFSAVPRL